MRTRVEWTAEATYNVIPFLPRNFVNQRCDCDVWNRRYKPRSRSLAVRVVGAIVWYDNFYLPVGFLPVGVRSFLTSMARVEYKDGVPFLDAVVLAECFERLDYRRSGGFFVE